MAYHERKKESFAVGLPTHKQHVTYIESHFALCLICNPHFYYQSTVMHRKIYDLIRLVHFNVSEGSRSVKGGRRQFCVKARN